MLPCAFGKNGSPTSSSFFLSLSALPPPLPYYSHTNTPPHRADTTPAEKRAYIAAVQCLTKAPSKLPAAQYPGAKTRFDDFMAVHMKNTLSIHGTGNFLAWHRYFTFAYESALRRECGFNGTQPVSSCFSFFSWLCGRCWGRLARRVCEI